MNTDSGIPLWALALFVAGVALGGLHLSTMNPPKGVQPAVVYSSEVLEGHKEAGLHSSYRQGGHNYLEVHYEGEWQVLKCSARGWEQQGLYFRQNLAAVAEGCELETLGNMETKNDT